MKKHEIEKKVEEALSSLDHVERAGPGPFFFTRVQARLNRDTKTLWEKISAIIARPAIATAIVALVITVNAVVIFQSDSDVISTEQATNAPSDESDVDVIAYYEFENNTTDPQ